MLVRDLFQEYLKYGTTEVRTSLLSHLLHAEAEANARQFRRACGS